MFYFFHDLLYMYSKSNQFPTLTKQSHVVDVSQALPHPLLYPCPPQCPQTQPRPDWRDSRTYSCLEGSMASRTWQLCLQTCCWCPTTVSSVCSCWTAWRGRWCLKYNYRVTHSECVWLTGTQQQWTWEIGISRWSRWRTRHWLRVESWLWVESYVD